LYICVVILNLTDFEKNVSNSKNLQKTCYFPGAGLEFSAQNLRQKFTTI
jgi:hypothetical protein